MLCVSEGRKRDGAGWHQIAAALLISAFLLQTILSLKDNSTVTDEAFDIASGYSYWITRDGRMNREHPPLVKLWLSLPLLPLGLKVPTEAPSWRTGAEGAFSVAFLYQDLRNVGRILFRARISIVLLGVLLALFVRRWAEDLWGPEAGLAALFLYVFEPNTIAHSSIGTLDLALTAFTLISMYYVWQWQRSRRAADGCLASIALGFALLSKYTAIAFLPLSLAEIVVVQRMIGRAGRRPWFAAAAAFLRLLLGATIVVFCVYAAAFNWHPLLPAGRAHHTLGKILAHAPLLNAAVHSPWITALAHRLWVPDLEKYIEGALDQFDNLRDHTAYFLMGRFRPGGWWYYFLVAFLIKVPIPILLLVVLRLMFLRPFPIAAGEHMLLVPVVGIFALSCFCTVDLGLRYVLPAFPFLFVWLSRIIVLGLGRSAGGADPPGGERGGGEYPIRVAAGAH